MHIFVSGAIKKFFNLIFLKELESLCNFNHRVLTASCRPCPRFTKSLKAILIQELYVERLRYVHLSMEILSVISWTRGNKWGKRRLKSVGVSFESKCQGSLLKSHGLHSWHVTCTSKNIIPSPFLLSYYNILSPDALPRRGQSVW